MTVKNHFVKKMHSSLLECCKIADRIRRLVEDQENIVYGKSYKVTVSIGIYTITEELDQDKFLIKVDKALYKAKIRKNTVVVLNLQDYF